MPLDACALHDHFASAVDAIDWLLVNRRDAIRKALNPLNQREHAKIALRLSRAIKGITGPAEANAMREALATLDVDWPNLSHAARERVITTAKRSVARNIPKAIEPRVQEQFRLFGKPIARGAKRFAVTQHKLDISATMSSRDVALARFAARSPVNFIRDEYGKRSETMGRRVREVVAQGIERGAGSREIVRDLKAQIGDLGKLGRGDFYWEVTALAFTNRARTIGQLNAFQEAGFERYVWESVLDEVTTETCRFLHGKTFNVNATLQTVQQAEQADNPEALKIIQPWITTGRDDATGDRAMFYRDAKGEKVIVATIEQGAKGTADKIGDYSQKISDKGLQDQGLSMPPIHGLCRSTILPDITGPQPKTQPAQPKASPPVPAGAPKPKPPPFPKKGVHFENFFSSIDDPEAERQILSAMGECGALPMLKKKPIGRVVFTNKVDINSTPANVMISEGANGEYFSEMRHTVWTAETADQIGKLKQRSTLKVRSDRSHAPATKTPSKTNEPTGWSVSEAREGAINKARATMVHEVGHHVHFEGLGLSGGTIDYDLSTPEFVKVDRVVKKAWQGRPAASHLVNEQLAAITGYSESSRFEYFAEAFALHFYDPAALRARDLRAFEMVEEVRKIRKLGKPDRRLVIGKALVMIADEIEKAKRADDWTELTKISRKTADLFLAGRLTTDKLDKLEAEAVKAAGANNFNGWREDFARYREWLFWAEID